jgi:membrane-associated phospholipid phosphatase
MTRVRAAVAGHYGLTQIAIVLAGIECYELARELMAPNWPVAVRHAHDIVSAERVAHLAWEQPLQQAFLGVPDLVRALNVFYFVGHFVLTGVFFVWLYHRSRPAFRRFRNGFLTASALALAIHWRFPTAPPRLAEVGLADTLRQLSGVDIGSPGSAWFSNPVAAVPSLHAGFALGVGIGLCLYARRRVWKAIGVVYPLAVVITTIVTGNHFILDAVAGMLVLALGFTVAEVIFEREGARLVSATRGGAVR